MHPFLSCVYYLEAIIIANIIVTILFHIVSSTTQRCKYYHIMLIYHMRKLNAEGNNLPQVPWLGSSRVPFSFSSL